MYPNPRTDFERFVNKFVSRDKGPKRKEELVKAVTEEWKSGGYRESKEKLAAFLAAGNEVRDKLPTVDYGFRRLDSPSEKVSCSAVSSISDCFLVSATPKMVDMSVVSDATEVKKSLNAAAISSCLLRLGIDEEILDVTDVSIFMSSLESFAVLLLNVQHSSEPYESLLSRGCYGGSKIGGLRDEVDDAVKKLTLLLKEVASLEIGSCSVGVLKTSIAKSKLLTSAVGDMQCINAKLQDLRRRLQVRIAQMLQECDSSRLSSTITFQCLQSTSCNWEDALASVVDDMNSKAFIHGPLSYCDLISCGQLLRSTNALPLSSVLDHCNKSSVSSTGAANVLLERFPLLLLSHSGKQQVLVNLHELVISSQSLAYLLNLDKDIQESSVPVESGRHLPEINVEQQRPGPAKGNGGRPSRHVQYPTLVEEVTVLVNLHELVISSQSLAYLLNLDKDIQESSVPVESGRHLSEINVEHQRPGPAKGNGGRPSRHVQYPTLVEEVTAFIKLHSFTAQARRRTDACTSM